MGGGMAERFWSDRPVVFFESSDLFWNQKNVARPLSLDVICRRSSAAGVKSPFFCCNET